MLSHFLLFCVIYTFAAIQGQVASMKLAQCLRKCVILYLFLALTNRSKFALLIKINFSDCEITSRLSYKKFV